MDDVGSLCLKLWWLNVLRVWPLHAHASSEADSCASLTSIVVFLCWVRKAVCDLQNAVHHQPYGERGWCHRGEFNEQQGDIALRSDS